MQHDERGLDLVESVQLVAGALAMAVVVGAIIQIARDRLRERREDRNESVRGKP